MKRRDFILQISTVAIAGFISSIPLAFRAKAKALNPQIEKLQIDADLGPDCTIQAINEKSGVITAKIKYQKFSFFLYSTDGETWQNTLG